MCRHILSLIACSMKREKLLNKNNDEARTTEKKTASSDGNKNCSSSSSLSLVVWIICLARFHVYELFSCSIIFPPPFSAADLLRLNGRSSRMTNKSWDRDGRIEDWEKSAVHTHQTFKKIFEFFSANSFFLDNLSSTFSLTRKRCLKVSNGTFKWPHVSPIIFLLSTTQVVSSSHDSRISHSRAE